MALVGSTVATAAIACGDGGSSGPPPPPPSPPPPPPPEASYEIGYSTLLGGSDFEEIREPVALAQGRLLFGARTLSLNMPTSPAAYQRLHGGGQGDSFLAILSADGRELEAATYFGGSGMERPPYGIDVASSGDIVFGSGTSSPNIPMTQNAYRSSIHTPFSPPGDGYVCRISQDLATLRWCTYTGGGWPRGGLMLDRQENVLVAGRVIGANFPTTSGVVQRTARGTDDAFILKLSPDGTRAVFSTRLGGTGNAVGEVALSVREAADGDILIAGISTSADFPVTSGAAQTTSLGPTDGFLARLNSTATALSYATYISGSANDACEHRHFALAGGSVLCAGTTTSNDLPTTAGAYAGGRDGFVALLTEDGSAFSFVRSIGSPGDEHLLGPVVAPDGSIFLFGNTTSASFPTTDNAVQGTFGGGPTDAILVILDGSGSTVLFSSYFGGNGDDLIRGVVVSQTGEVYLAGRTTSTNFPTTEGALQRTLGGDNDGFVVKLVPRTN